MIGLCSGGIQRGGGIGAMGIGMRSGRSRMALLVAVRDGARLSVSMPAVGAGAGTIVGGGWWSGNFGGKEDRLVEICWEEEVGEMAKERPSAMAMPTLAPKPSGGRRRQQPRSAEEGRPGGPRATVMRRRAVGR